MVEFLAGVVITIAFFGAMVLFVFSLMGIAEGMDKELCGKRGKE